MILSRNMLKRVGERRHPFWTPTVVQNQSLMLLLKSTALVALSLRFLITGIRLVLVLYFFMVAHKAACQTLKVEDLLELYEDMLEVLLVLEIFLTEDS